MLKVGQALAISGASLLLDVVGYVPNTDQTGSVLFTMNFGSHMFVGICSVICAIAMFAYKLDKKTYANIVASLREKGLAN